MTNRTDKVSPLLYARFAGLLYLLMVPLGFFGYSYIPTFLVVPDDAATTVSNIIISETLFRFSIVSALAVQVINIILVLVLFRLLKPVNKYHASLMVIFLLVGTPIAMLNQVNLFSVLQLLSGHEYLMKLESEQLNAQVMLFLDTHRYGSQIAAIFFGLWLLPMGYLVFKSGFLPRIIGILLIIGGLGYLIDSFTIFIIPSFTGIVPFTFWGEILFPLWLLIKGVNVQVWNNYMPESPE